MDYIFDKYQGAGNDFILIDARSRSFKSMNQFQKVSYCKFVLYQLHRNLIETADEGYSPIKGLDFRGCR